MSKKEVILIVIAAVLVIGGTVGYYLGYDDHGWERAVDRSSSNSAMLGRDGGLPVITTDIAYFKGAEGHFAAPEIGGPYPGVIMIHEWWGLNDNIRDMARELAEEGYIVLAVDLYSGKVAETREEAQALRGALTLESALANMRSAAAYLKTHGVAKVASLGWCFGGGKSLELALSGERLDATVIYYGELVSDMEKLRSIRWPVLGIFGDKDQSIPVADVSSFKNALTQIGVQNEIHVYPGVGHAFANPSGTTYAPNETKDAWGKTLAFLNRVLKGE